jgi:hypothetical protein
MVSLKNLAPAGEKAKPIAQYLGEKNVCFIGKLYNYWAKSAIWLKIRHCGFHVAADKPAAPGNA